MIGPVHGVVAIHAALPQQVLRCKIRGETALVLGQARVTVLGVTALAELRRSHNQHARLGRAMWIVAGTAVLSHWRVFPKMRSASFRMTCIAGVVRILPNQVVILAVRIVTTGAVHFALAYRVRIRLHGLRALLLMTVETNLGLRGRREHRIAGTVTRVAVGTGQVVEVVAAAVPVSCRVVSMAIGTQCVLLRDTGPRVFAKRKNGWTILAAAHSRRMIAAGTMTGLALQVVVTKRCVSVTRNTVAGLEYRECRVVVMAGKTRICTLAAIACRFVRIIR